MSKNIPTNFAVSTLLTGTLESEKKNDKPGDSAYFHCFRYRPTFHRIILSTWVLQHHKN